jgi:THAP4-like, heme-binding beta-barrel domain
VTQSRGSGGTQTWVGCHAREVTLPLHHTVEPLDLLLGSWSGSGHGQYSTIEDFDYEATIEFSHVGKPCVSYSQVSRHTADGRLLHGETGFLRVPTPGSIELVVAHPNGTVEISEGTIRSTEILLRSTCIALPRSRRLGCLREW